MRRIISQFTPFLFIGIALLALTFGLILFFYLFIIGACIGFVLFLISWIRNNFFPSKPPIQPTQSPKGRIIDSDEWNRL